MGNFIESYFGNNFTNATSSFPAGMNFTNLVIAIPIIASVMLIAINIFRHSQQLKVLSIKFQLITFFTYLACSTAFYHHSNLNLFLLSCWELVIYFLTSKIFYLSLGYLVFVMLAWCIYKDMNCCPLDLDIHQTSDVGSLEEKILTKITEMRKTTPKNILINGHWGSGKTYFVKNTLVNLIPQSIYISCIDYASMPELVTTLVKKSNNVFIRFLLSISLSRLISIIGHTELKQYIGTNKVIIFDEFERLADYNKIDHMHIVSLIQYLNHEKNCVCILVANEDHLNDANQFTNVREKLISYTYHYKILFDYVIKIIQEKYQKTLNKQNSTAEHVVKLTLKKPDDNDDVFSRTYQKLESWYQIDNNIRMIEHLYIKINQLYQATLQMIDEDEFHSKRYTSEMQKNELFIGLFGYVDTIIIQLYYLYLKHPYNLTAIETLSVSYQKDKFTKALKHLYNKPKPEEPVESQIDKKNKDMYFESKLIQRLALEYLNKNPITYESNNSKTYEKSYDLNYILTNQVFENINDSLITDYLGKEEQVIQLLSFGKRGKTSSQNIKNFMRDFKETICESEDSKLVIEYFKGINILEERFSRLVDDIELPWDYSIVTDYIAYCQYIDETYPRGNHNNIRPVSYNRITYINALIIQLINDSTTDNFKLIISEITNYINKTKNQSYQTQNFETLVYELTCIQAIEQNKVNIFIELIKQIADKLAEKYHPMLLLNFMYLSYQELKDTIDKERTRIDVNRLRNFDMRVYPELRRSIIQCTENLISFSTEGSNTTEYLKCLFMHLSNFDVNISNTKNNKAFIALIVKIKEIYNTNELKQEFINMYIAKDLDIPKQVAKILQAELDAAAKSSNPK